MDYQNTYAVVQFQELMLKNTTQDDFFDLKKVEGQLKADEAARKTN